MLRANNEKEFLKILKIVSEEAVKKSRQTLKESADTAQSRYHNGLSQSESMYGVNLSEREDEPSDETPKKEAEEEEVDVPEEEGEEDEELDFEKFGVSFDSVIKDINTLRAGRSTKDKDIKDELNTYYDRLDEDERQILHLFLSELSKILQGILDGDDAIDPSDPPYNFNIDAGDEEGTSAEQGTDVTKPAQDSKSQEDTAPPIKVNETQNLNEIRTKFRRLMKRY